MHVGKAYSGLKNRALVAGRATFVGDIQLPGMAHMAVLRSPHASARILSIDTTGAEDLDGVLHVMTGKDARDEHLIIPEASDPRQSGAKNFTWYALAQDRVRFVGDAVAAAVAEDPHTARKALDLIDVAYEVATPALDADDALHPDSPLVEPSWGENLLAQRHWEGGTVEGAMSAAPRRVTGSVKLGRLTGVPLEPRGTIAEYDTFHDTVTLWDSTQNPHPLRTYVAQTLGLPEPNIRVIQPSVGGAFGLKLPPFQEPPLVAWLAKHLDRPVKWIEERDEHLQAIGHARDFRFDYEVAFQDDGTVDALDVRILADVGAPTAQIGWRMAIVAAAMLPTVYTIEHLRVELTVVTTNKCPWNAYRGFGKDASSYFMDRLMDRIARETGLDRPTVRFRNFIQPDQFPYPQTLGAMLDSGDYPAALTKALDMVGYADFEQRRTEARERGRYLGLGIGQELMPAGSAMPGAVLVNAYDGATVRIGPLGDVTVLTGVTSPGGGNETAIAQIAAEFLGCGLDRITVVQGDTASCPYGLGNFSSRSTMYGGSAVQLATTELREKLERVAASMLGAKSDEMRVRDGQFSVAGDPDSSVSFEEVVDQVYCHAFGEHVEDEEPGLESTRYFRMSNIYHQPDKQGRFSNYPAWAYGVAVCVVEVEPETGVVEILEYHFVDDAGTLINPRLATANLHGGIAQGIGGALYEQLVYDPGGALTTTTLMDYTIPTALEIPALDVEHLETPSPFTPLGMKGIGESGIGAAQGAINGAIDDAFPEFDLQLDQVPLTPVRVWRAIRDARARAE